MNYYNEIELSARRWLRELIKDGLIPDGYIDNRPIQEIRAEEIKRGGFAQCHFFAGIGGWPLALRIAGVPDDEPLWTGSCPCQPFSQSGRQMGNTDSRHLFPTWRRLIARCGPSRILGEQVASKLGREWLARVCLEMASLGYATRGADLCSAGVGSPNVRQRLFWLADTEGERRVWGGARPEQAGNAGTANRSGLGDTYRAGLQGGAIETVQRARGREERAKARCAGAPLNFWAKYEFLQCTDGKARRIEPGTFPLAHGIPGRVGLLRGYGNAINPWIAAEFIKANLK